MDAPGSPPDAAAPPVLRFADGIPGFGGAKGFLLSDLTDDGTFQQLTCVEDPDLAIVVAVPWLFFPEYAPELPESDRLSLGIEDPAEAIVFCSVSFEEAAGQLVVNLRAPFIANATTREARQVILDDEDLPLRATVDAGA